MSVVYWILETPAKSAAAYPHQVQQKTRIFGVKSVKIVTSFIESQIPNPKHQIPNKFEIQMSKCLKLYFSDIRVPSFGNLDLENLNLFSPPPADRY